MRRRVPALPFVFLGAALALSLGAVFYLLAHRPAPPEGRRLPVLGELPPFRLQSERGTWVTRSDYDATVLVADFIFTRCRGTCPVLTSKMAALARQLADTPVRFVSISVDPENDTVEALAAYAKEHGADPARWTFLRGERGVVRALARDGFKLAVSDGDPNGPEPIVHSTKLVLVDGRGRVRAHVDAFDDAGLARLSADARALVREGR